MYTSNYEIVTRENYGNFINKTSFESRKLNKKPRCFDNFGF